MLRILGSPINQEDATNLLVALLADGSPEALTAAQEIKRGVDWNLDAVSLTAADRDAVLACLIDAPDRLADIRLRLRRDQGQRILRAQEFPRSVMGIVCESCPLCERSMRPDEIYVRIVRIEGTHRVYGRYCPHCGREIGLAPPRLHKLTRPRGVLLLRTGRAWWCGHELPLRGGRLFRRCGQPPSGHT